MTLKDAKDGDVVVIKEIHGEEDILKKVSAMGLRKGSQFEVLRRCGRNILIKNGSNRLIISKKLAENFEIEVINHRESPSEEITCDLVDKACPEEGKPFGKRYRHRHGRLAKFRTMFRKICPFLKED